MSPRRLGSVLLGLLALAGCAAAPGDDADSSADAVSESAKVQPNDVSILFPLGDGLLAPDALLPKEIYGVAANPGEGGTPGVAYEGLRLVSMRFDPCFATLKPIEETNECENQIRLVFQPSDKDAAVHALYKISRQELTSAVKQIAALRGDADLGPLGVHPMMKKEGLSGPTATALKAIVVKLARSENLIRFTQFSSSGLGSAWNFRGFDVRAGAVTPVEIPALPPKTKTVAFFRGFSKDQLSGDFQPMTTSSDNFALFANTAKVKASSDAAKQAAWKANQDVEDPTMHTPNTIDCASCHAAQPLRALVAEKMLGFKTTPIAGETATTSATELSVHMFSYMGKNPSIHRRTAAETAAIAKYMSSVL
jgi:hypothetical protein